MAKSKYKRKLTAILSADVVGYSRLGQEENAKTMIIQLLNLVPGYSIEKHKEILLYKNPARIERIIKALRKAGSPE